MTEVNKERLLKIITLYQRGSQGERDNARRAAEREILKLGITLDEFLSDYSQEEYAFTFKGKTVLKLLVQIIASVISDQKQLLGFSENRVHVKCSKSEFVEISTKYNILKKDFASEFDIFFHGFVVANNIFSNIPNDEHEDLSKEERSKVMRAYSMSNSIKRSNLYKQLSGS